MRRLLSVIAKEFIQLRRDPRMMFIVFFAPVIQLVLLGYAANLDVRHLPLAVCDLDRSAQSRDYVRTFINSGYFELKASLERLSEVDACIDRGLASVALVVPRGFGDDITAGRQASVLIISDGSESNAATIGINASTTVSRRYSQLIVLERFERLKAAGLRPVLVNPELRVWYNPSLKSRNFFVPGVLALVLMMMTMLLTSMALVREKETGTLEQLIVTPIRPVELIAGKLVPFVAVGFGDAVLVLAAARWLLGVPVRGSVPLLFVLGTAFILTTLGLGLFISTISRNQQQAMLTAAFLIIPSILLGGFVFPIENMPRFFQLLTYAVPIRYFLVIVRGIFLKGVGWAELWDETAALLAIGALILSLSVLRFRKRLD